MLSREEAKRFLLDDGAAQLKVAEQSCRVVRSVDRHDRGEHPRGILHQRREHKLEPALLELGHDVEGLRVPTKPAAGRLDVAAGNAVEANAQIRLRRFVRGPDEP